MKPVLFPCLSQCDMCLVCYIMCVGILWSVECFIIASVVYCILCVGHRDYTWIGCVFRAVYNVWCVLYRVLYNEWRSVLYVQCVVTDFSTINYHLNELAI